MKNLISIIMVFFISVCSAQQSQNVPQPQKTWKSFNSQGEMTDRDYKLARICSYYGGVQYYDKLGGGAQCRHGFYARVK
jgi:hypothetical protein